MNRGDFTFTLTFRATFTGLGGHLFGGAFADIYGFKCPIILRNPPAATSPRTALNQKRQPPPRYFRKNLYISNDGRKQNNLNKMFCPAWSIASRFLIEPLRTRSHFRMGPTSKELQTTNKDLQPPCLNRPARRRG